MSRSNVIELTQPGQFEDHLTEILRKGAQSLILSAVEAEFSAFLETYSHEKLEDGRLRVVRHGHLPTRKVVTGIGAIPVKVPRSRDRKSQQGKEGIRFASQVLPPYVRRTKSIDVAIPYLYLKGLSSGDFSSVMPVLLGKHAVGFSADTVLRLRKVWKQEWDQWAQRRLDSKAYVYLWADGVYLQRMRNSVSWLLWGLPLKGKRSLWGFWMGIGKVQKAGESCCLI